MRRRACSYHRTVFCLSAASSGKGSSMSTWSSRPWWQWWPQTGGWRKRCLLKWWGWERSIQSSRAELQSIFFINIYWFRSVSYNAVTETQHHRPSPNTQQQSISLPQASLSSYHLWLFTPLAAAWIYHIDETRVNKSTSFWQWTVLKSLQSQIYSFSIWQRSIAL